jgi:hypothetical protein
MLIFNNIVQLEQAHSKVLKAIPLHLYIFNAIIIKVMGLKGLSYGIPS